MEVAEAAVEEGGGYYYDARPAHQTPCFLTLPSQLLFLHQYLLLQQRHLHLHLAQALLAQIRWLVPLKYSARKHWPLQHLVASCLLTRVTIAQGLHFACRWRLYR